VPMMIYFQGEFFEWFVMFLRRSTEARPNCNWNLIIALQCIKILALIQYQKIRLVLVPIFFFLSDSSYFVVPQMCQWCRILDDLYMLVHA
jgi:hypothetical protein